MANQGETMTHEPNGRDTPPPPENSYQGKVQEAEYSFPYHYIPQSDGHDFSQTRHYSWGFRYLGGLEVVAQEVARYQPRSLLDVGCGDGRFLMEASRRFPTLSVMGIDYSAAAISFARAFNPGLRFEVRDVVVDPLGETFELATLIEVLEHIEPKEVSGFLAAIQTHLEPGGRLVLTVPHKNSTLIPKHHQHFDAVNLRAELEEHFEVEKIVYFDSRRDLPIRLAKTLLGGGGTQFVITNRVLNRLFMKTYLKRFLYVEREEDCRRLLAVARVGRCRL